MQPGRRIGILLMAALGAVGVAIRAAGQGADGGAVVAVKAAKTYHRPSCASARRAPAKGKVEVASADEAEGQGYRPCPLCKPGPAAAKPEEGAEPKAIGKAKTARKGAAKGRSAESSDGMIKFSRDIAPILLANCADCHGPAQKRGGFDLSTFARLMEGGKDGKVIDPGNPDGSRLVELIQTREMPRGNMRRMSDDAIARVTAWVQAGALLDAGRDPAADLKSYAPTANDLRNAELARLTPDQRDAKAREAALDRWKKSGASGTPTMTAERTLLLFSTLPTDRAKRLLKALEERREMVQAILGTTPAGPEKLSLYVFPAATNYAEFVRSVESREPESGVEGHGRLDVPSPYLAAVDPLGGRDEPPARKAAARSKKDKEDDASGGPDRSLAGLLAEPLATASAAQAGKPPAWLAAGLGAFVARDVDPRSPFVRDLRNKAAEQARLGWTTKANEALGGEGEPQTVQAMGFSLLEWLAAADRAKLVPFVRMMLAGQGKLDDTIRSLWGPDATREQFLELWGGFVSTRYGRGR